MRPTTKTLVLLLGAMIPSAFGQTTAPATRPRFTISKETTIVDGPVRPDGTIDYFPVMNGIVGKGISREQNAAILLLQIDFGRGDEEHVRAMMKEMGAEATGEPRAVKVFNRYMQESGHAAVTEDDVKRQDEEEQFARTSPWKRTDHPAIAAWLDASAPGLAIVEKACERQHYFAPTLDDTSAGGFVFRLPPLWSLRHFHQVLLTRAMLRAGEGKLLDAIQDIGRTRIVARFSVESRLLISHLVGIAIEREAIQALETLLVKNAPDASAVALIKKELERLPALPEMLANTQEMEELLTFASAMTIIRGDGARYLRGIAGNAGEPGHEIDQGDLMKADWDTLLKEMRRLMEDDRRINAFPFEARKNEVLKRSELAKEMKVPGTFLSTTLDVGPAPLEKFLKMRAGEDVIAFSKRLAFWIAVGDPDLIIRVSRLEQRGTTERTMANTAVTIAEYRLTHGSYPNALEGPLPEDLFGDGKLHYRREGNGFLLWGAGNDQKDGGGTGDDMVLRAEK